ncbi:sugar-binding transcriptional regulator [Salinimonas marina]|uniref:Sugar-binding transcriptional regulator n=1 Tax=Salinimonas marina TaxID=2785918 RepID=A0A7S9DWX1_9ALTE|nr:sugar-binding transcriptional regulator [Salinimonas marina]QPG05444.1 sugar-binding transcriptional regulator [Salinimonas marina]
MSRKTLDQQRLDDAARAGWLYYVAGATQDDIARQLNISRQTAQRLVALAISEGLVKVRLEHPVASCMELANALKQRFGLQFCDVVPSVNEDPHSTLGLGQAGASAIERLLRDPDTRTIAFGTGRVLRACADELNIQQCPNHKIISLVGNIANDGAATRYDAAVYVAEKLEAQHYPMPLPVIAESQTARDAFHQLPHVSRILDLASAADATFVGIGNLGRTSPLAVDGFVDEQALEELESRGGVGEVISWVYNAEGAVMPCDINSRVTSVPLKAATERPVVGIAAGQHKCAAIVGALRSRLINALITNEYTARQVLNLCS